MFYFTSILLLPLWAICLWTYSRRDRLAKYAHWPNLALCASRKPTATEAVDKICFLSHEHETATVLADMVQADGVKAWPPKTNHDHSTWPVALRPYKLMYLELASLLPVAKPSLDDIENSIAINRFVYIFAVSCNSIYTWTRLRMFLKVSRMETMQLRQRPTMLSIAAYLGAAMLIGNFWLNNFEDLILIVVLPAGGVSFLLLRPRREMTPSNCLKS